jgi:hypothetical protein
VTAEPEQEPTIPDADDGVSVEQWDEIIHELDSITRTLTSIDGRLGTIDELLADS